MTKVSVDELRRYRLGAHGLLEPANEPEGALAGWAVQDSPPGGATMAVLARTSGELPVGWLEEAITGDRSVASLYNARTATSVVPAGDAPAFATALLPRDDAGLGAIVVNAVPEQKSGYEEPVATAVEAIAEILDGRELSRDDLHEALRGALPKALLPWCEGCGSHHARRGLLVMASLSGKLCLAGKVGRQPLFARGDQWLGGWKAPEPDAAAKALLERFLQAYGPSTPAEFAAWAGLGKPHAKALWALVEADLAEVQVDDGPPRWMARGDIDHLEDPPQARGVILLGPGDPLLQAKDREVLVPDAAVRKKVWTAIPTTGLLLADGTAVATWKAKKAGRALAVTVEAFGKVSKANERAAEAAFERVAPHRGAGAATVTWA